MKSIRYNDYGHDSDGHDSSSFTTITLCELSKNGKDVDVIGPPTSTKLPIYDATIEGSGLKSIIDSGATSYFIGEYKVKELDLKEKFVASRKMRVVDKDILYVHGMIRFEVKVRNLPSEMVIEYIFPLGRVD